MEIDEVFVPAETYDLAVAGDEEARKRIVAMLDGITLYFHGFRPPDEWGPCKVVTLRDLEAANLINSVVLHQDIV